MRLTCRWGGDIPEMLGQGKASKQNSAEDGRVPSQLQEAADGVAAHQPIAAHETEHPGKHLIAGGNIVRVQQNDFVGFASGIDLAGVA